MSDSPTFKAPRPLPQIQGEYAQLLQRAGQCQYQIEMFQRDLKMYNDSLKDLNAEAFAANEASERAKAEAEEKAKQADEAAAKAEAASKAETEEKKES